nr:hypothetical protein [uncultured Flavobacterium sp.]
MKNFLLLLVLVTASCSKDNDQQFNSQLPAITQTGANTFGATINGQIMVPRNSIGYMPPGSSHSAVNYMKANDWEQIQAGDAKTKKGYIYIYIENKEKNGLLKLGNYIIGNSNGASEHEFCENTLITAIIFDSKEVQKTYLSIADTGTINITRSDNDIISGTFSCKLRFKDNPKDIIEIKDGRVDFNKNTINSTDFK